MNDSNPLAWQVLEAGDQWLAATPRQPATQRAYRLEILRFVRWLTETGCGRVAELPRNLVVSYLDDVASEDPEAHARTGVKRTLKTSSVLQTKRILSAMLMWAAEMELLPLALATQGKQWKAPTPPSPSDQRPEALAPPRPLRVPTSEEGRARLAFVTALSYWTGASPQEIARLRRRSLKIEGDVLRIYLPDGSGQQTVCYGPPAMAAMWRRLKALTHDSDFAIVRHGRTSPVTPSTISRELREAAPVESGTTRALRKAGIEELRSQGWPEAIVLRQYRRRGLSHPLRPTSPRLLAELMSKIPSNPMRPV